MSIANEFRLLIAVRLMNLAMRLVPRRELRGRVVTIGITRTLKTLLLVERRDAWAQTQLSDLLIVSKK